MLLFSRLSELVIARDVLFQIYNFPVVADTAVLTVVSLVRRDCLDAFDGAG